MALRETASYMLWRRNSARVAQCVTIGVVPPVVRISGAVMVRRVRGKMDKFVVVQRKRKRSSSRERDFCKRDNDTSSCSESAGQVFSSENNIGNFVGVPLTDTDRRKVLFNCWSPRSGFSFSFVTVGAHNRSFQKHWLNQGPGTYGSWARYGSFDDAIWLAWYFLNTIVTENFLCNFPTKPSATLCSARSRINSKKQVIKEKIQVFTIVKNCWFCWKMHTLVKKVSCMKCWKILCGSYGIQLKIRRFHGSLSQKGSRPLG